jgi:hypothetical protein
MHHRPRRRCRQAAKHCMHASSDPMPCNTVHCRRIERVQQFLPLVLQPPNNGLSGYAAALGTPRRHARSSSCAGCLCIREQARRMPCLFARASYRHAGRPASIVRRGNTLARRSADQKEPQYEGDSHANPRTWRCGSLHAAQLAPRISVSASAAMASVLKRRPRLAREYFNLFSRLRS